jgi:hypothetical protein
MFGAIMRVRSVLSHTVHSYFRRKVLGINNNLLSQDLTLKVLVKCLVKSSLPFDEHLEKKEK